MMIMFFEPVRPLLEVPTATQYKNWVTSLVNKFEPGSSDCVPELLRSYSGREAELVDKLVAKHLGEESPKVKEERESEDHTLISR